MTHEFSLVPALMLGALVSQAISRRLCPLNFYDTILEHDGHHIDHLIPPRDLRSWQHLPVSTIANFRPIVVESLEPTRLALLLKERSLTRFPLVIDGKVIGILTRQDAETACELKRKPEIEPAVFANPTDSIRRVQSHLIESTTGMVLITDGPDGRLLALLTLHDLVRAEQSVADQQQE
jgi:CIC family chloride channel protein